MAKKARSPVLDRLVYGVVRTLLFVLAYLPEFVVYPMLDSCGRLFLRCSRRRREIAMRNLEQAFGSSRSQAELLRMAYRSCGANCMVIADLARVERMLRSGRHHARIACDGIVELLAKQDALCSGAPPIMCTPHLGSWEIAGIYLGTVYDGAHIIARPLANPLVQEWLRRSRALLGLQVHPRRGGVRKLLSALRNKKAVGILPDQNQRIRGLFVEVFGKLASCDRSAARLSQLTGSPISPVACVRVGRRYRFQMHLTEPFLCEPGDEGMVAGTKLLQERIEELIRCAPEQYLWVHDRYRSRPKDGRA